MAASALSRRGQTASSQLMTVFVPMLIVCILGVCFSLIVSDVGPRYSANYTDSSYSSIVSSTNEINSISNRTSQAMLSSGTDQTNVLTSIEKLSTGAYNSILIIGEIPAVYEIMITVIAQSLNIPAAAINLIIEGVVFLIVTAAIFLALGRR